jgi:hypothetical protein
MGAIELRIDQILLDSANPRIGTASSQRDALQKILDDQKNKLVVLAEDIVNEGMSPIDRLLVIREKKDADQYIVVEGNRRIAALKVLSNLNILTGLSVASAIQKRFEGLSKNFTIADIEPIACYEMKNREEANRWIQLRHTGENEGRGVVAWSGLASARFRGMDPALQALEFIVKHGNLSDDQRRRLEENFPVTTLNRLLSTKEVREKVGVEVENGKLKSKFPGTEIIKPLRRMALDLAEKRINVSQLKNKELQVKYVNEFSRSEKPDLSKSETSRDLLDFESGDFSPRSGRGPGRPVGHQDPSQRKTVVPRGLKFNVTSAKIAEIFKELKTLKMEETPNAGAVLLRVFLELSVDHFMIDNHLEMKEKGQNGGMRDKRLDKKVRETISHLVTAKGCKAKDFSAMSRDLSDANSPLHIDLLHAYVHSLFQTPKVRDLRIAWDHAEPFFAQIWA